MSVDIFQHSFSLSLSLSLSLCISLSLSLDSYRVSDHERRRGECILCEYLCSFPHTHHYHCQKRISSRETRIRVQSVSLSLPPLPLTCVCVGVYMNLLIRLSLSVSVCPVADSPTASAKCIRQGLVDGQHQGESFWVI